MGRDAGQGTSRTREADAGQTGRNIQARRLPQRRRSVPVQDSLGRGLVDLRISVTDRCNLRCPYCMPKELFGPDHAYLARSDLLSFEELARVARVFADLGVRKIRLTGGEPLLRRDLEHLVEKLASIDGIEDIAMTTNGMLLAAKARRLADAGLNRVTVSLDSLDDEVFAKMNGTGAAVARVLAGIDAAESSGLSPIKVNCVVKRNVNESSILEMARHFHGTGHILRFIEYMDVGTTNGWRLADVVPAGEILSLVDAELPLAPIDDEHRSGVATRYRYRDGGGEIGVIASVTSPFCATCTRARLSAEGMLFTCLFASDGFDLKTPVRSGATSRELERTILDIWARRADRYSEIRSACPAVIHGETTTGDSVSEHGRDVPCAGQAPPPTAVVLGHPRREMSYLGG